MCNGIIVISLTYQTKRNIQMILIGIKEVTTGTGGGSEFNYSHVTHQQIDIIAGGEHETKDTLTNLYNDMVLRGNKSKSELIKLQDELDDTTGIISTEEYHKLVAKVDKLREHTQILKYDKVLIIEGGILK